MKLSFQKKLFIAFIFYGMILSTVSSFIFIKLYTTNIVSTHLENARDNLLEKSTALNNYAANMLAKLKAIHDSTLFQNYLKNSSPINNANEIFLNMAVTSSDIMQLRYIDKHGQEKIRVDRDSNNEMPHLVADNLLQNKAKRYYFQSILKQDKKSVWYSKIDLNVENNKIEVPHKPVLRIGVPVYVNEKKEGILIINIFMNTFLRTLSKSNTYKIFLIDKDGHFIFHPNTRFSWSQYLKTGFLLKDQFPLEAKNILEKDSYLIDTLYSEALDFNNDDGLKMLLQPIYSSVEEKIDAIIYDIIYFIIFVLLLSLPFSYLFAKSFNKIVKLLEDRTKVNEIQNKELLKANKAIKNAAYIKSQFLANMSHEIRTPLNAVLGFIDLLKKQVTGKTAKEYLNIIEKSSQSLLKIIEDILDFSKIESGKLNIEKINCNIRDEFESVKNLFIARCSSKNINLYLNFDEKVPNILHTDPFRLKQIISNLLSNAIKFTETSKSIILTVSYHDTMLTVSVKDEGKGIASDKLTHIFNSFSQEDNSTTRKYGGTGLGLTISAELVALLGGKLEVKSDIDVGSEFYFSIPVEVGEELFTETNEPTDTNFEGKKILLVEDNKTNQMFMKVVFEEINIDYDIANDGIEAVHKFKENHSYDIIFMDENMPNMNGIEASKQIILYEKENNLSHTPIVALTANALKGDRDKFLEAGMDEYLTKPVNLKDISKVIAKLV